MRLPNWAIKPKHKQEVVATEKGWEVKETGELLVRVRGLVHLLTQLEQKSDFVIEIEQPTKEEKVEVVEETKEMLTEAPSIDEQSEKEVIQEAPKRTTRKPRTTKAKA